MNSKDKQAVRRGFKFLNLRDADFTGAVLIDASFVGAQIAGAVFNRVQCGATDLQTLLQLAVFKEEDEDNATEE